MLHEGQMQPDQELAHLEALGLGKGRLREALQVRRTERPLVGARLGQGLVLLRDVGRPCG